AIVLDHVARHADDRFPVAEHGDRGERRLFRPVELGQAPDVLVGDLDRAAEQAVVARLVRQAGDEITLDRAVVGPQRPDRDRRADDRLERLVVFLGDQMRSPPAYMLG
ncbi:MAG: hypothetical protein ACREU5_10815, partial [Burkholderiales bacterium]